VPVSTLSGFDAQMAAQAVPKIVPRKGGAGADQGVAWWRRALKGRADTICGRPKVNRN